MSDLYYLNDSAPGASAPGPLPFKAYTPDGDIRTDLANHPDSVSECGFVLAPPRPDDTDTQTAEWDAAAETWVMVDRPVPEPQPDLSPRIIGKGTFLDLLMGSGGFTPANLVKAKADPQLAAMWIMLDLYSEVRIDHPTTVQGLAALVGLGYLTQAGADAVNAAWPVA